MVTERKTTATTTEVTPKPPAARMYPEYVVNFTLSCSRSFPFFNFSEEIIQQPVVPLLNRGFYTVE